MSLPRRSIIAPLALLGVLAAPAIAHAGPSDNATSDPWAVNVGLGPMINLEGAVRSGARRSTSSTTSAAATWVPRSVPSCPSTSASASSA